MTSLSSDGLRLDSVEFGYGPVPAVRGVSLTVPTGQLLALLGPSGCGKTTLLKLIGGYLTPTRGRIVLRERDITHLPPEARNAGFVFQNYALFPHLTARQNVAFGLEMRQVPRAARELRVAEMLSRVGLSATEADRKPAALSGGQQQRVALARALVIEPHALLLDEPLANLDRHLRDQLRTELRALQRQTNVTTVLVTHDQDEALAVADLVAVMGAGTLLQVGAPEDVYARPRTPFVARFLGAANLLPGNALGYPGACVMIRPENCLLNASEGAGPMWPGTVRAVAFLGADAVAEIACDNGLILNVRGRAPLGSAPGSRVTVGLPERHLWPVPDPDPPELSSAGATAPRATTPPA